MAKRKKSPSVKIPASVLKKEAEKMAKQIIRKEELKERKRVQREKVKLKAKTQVAKKKETTEKTAELYDPNFTREIWASLWIGLAFILVVVFWSDGSVAEWLTDDLFRSLFGRVMWVVPVALLALGMVMFVFKNFFFPPLRVLALLVAFTSLCGLMNLFVPLGESLALSDRFGGATGFAIGFFPRQFLGDMAAGVILVVLLWVSALTGLGLTVTDLIAWCKRLVAAKESDTSDESKKSKVEVKQSEKATKSKSKNEVVPPKPSRFTNEVEIIDSTGQSRKKVAPTSTVSLEEPSEDALTAAKNQAFGHWEAPELDLLEEKRGTISVDEQKLRQKAESIREKLEQFGINVTMRSVHVGPTVTQFTLEPAAGVKLNKITALKSDLALALAATNVRIEAPIRGQKLVGIEIPNEKRAIVSMREILESDAWTEAESDLKLSVGRGVDGKPIVVDLAKMPHLLIAGKTGSGKSVAMNAFLMSLLWNNAPDKLRMILIDPKRVELAPYNHLPHLLTPVITEPEKSVSALAWAVAEMNRRYKDFAEKGCRNLTEHNEKFPGEEEPYIVIVVDELADLMMVAGKDVEAAICRIAQMARAVGMHLIIATQRPSVDVVTGLIKANLPARIAFRVSSGIDSRVVIDSVGAEDLLGMGDMLYMDGNSGELTRIQGLYVSTSEVEKITNHIKLQFPEKIGSDQISEEINSQSIEGMAKGGVLTAGMEQPVAIEDLDAKFEEAVQVVLQNEKASASFLQRRLEIGYARAARILDQMEGQGIIGPSKGAKARDIYGRQD